MGFFKKTEAKAENLLNECDRLLEKMETGIAQFKGNTQPLKLVKTLCTNFIQMEDYARKLGLGNLVSLAKQGHQTCYLGLFTKTPPPRERIIMWEQLFQSIRIELSREGLDETSEEVVSTKALIFTRSENTALINEPPGQTDILYFVSMELTEAASIINKDNTYCCLIIEMNSFSSHEEPLRLIQQIRTMEKAGKIPILVIAEKLTPSERLRLTQLNVNKVFDVKTPLTDIQATIQQLIAQQKIQSGIVFLLESDANLRRRIKKDLEQEHFLVMDSDQPSHLMETALETSIDVILLSGMQKFFDPFTTCRQIKKQDRFSQTPIIFILDEINVMIRNNIYWHQGDDYLMLPYSLLETLKKVRFYTEYRRLKINHQPFVAIPTQSTPIPLAAQSASQPGPPPAISDKKLVPKVLVVDDDPFIREIIVFHLSRLGWQIITAQDGEKALALLKEESFSFLVMDLFIPFKSGFDVLKRIQKEGSKGDMKIVIMSSNSTDETVLRVFSLGADDFIAKPFNPDILISRMKRLLQESGE